MVKRTNYPELELSEPTCQKTEPLFFNLLRKIKNPFNKKEESNLIRHAKDELKLAGYDLNQKEEDPNKWIVENILELMNIFSKQGHSGFSASYCIDMFSKLAKYDLLTPLTGESDEWVNITDINGGNPLWQNKRCSHVFKDDKKAWDINGKVFIDKNGCYFTNSKSKVTVKFPYIPVTKYIKVK